MAGRRRETATKGARGPFRRLIGWIVKWTVRLCVVALLLVVAYRVVNPPITWLILTEWIRLGDIERDWTSLDDISPNLARAVVAAEDARFCEHVGFDFTEIGKAIERGASRGASTITQQTAKNVFLWPGRSWTRKGLEAAFAGAIELAWGKRRILEVYLNVAEMGEGVFGAEAAARHWCGVPAADLTLSQAARIAAILPNPKDRSASRPSGYVRDRARRIAGGAETIAGEGRDRCFLN